MSQGEGKRIFGETGVFEFLVRKRLVRTGGTSGGLCKPESCNFDVEASSPEDLKIVTGRMGEVAARKGREGDGRNDTLIMQDAQQTCRPPA